MPATGRENKNMAMDLRDPNVWIVNFATDITIQLTLIFLLIAIVIAPLIAPFVTGYVNTNYHPCGNNTGIFPGAIYIKNGM
ncbi:hypothetical protein GFB06_19410, partial [Escherichia coli]|nr:hypothetical protein [Escherichia coli]